MAKTSEIAPALTDVAVLGHEQGADNDSGTKRNHRDVWQVDGAVDGSVSGHVRGTQCPRA